MKHRNPRGPHNKLCSTFVNTDPISIAPMRTAKERDECAEMMAASEPWITLRRHLPMARRILEDPTRNVHIAYRHAEIVGFVVLCLVGAFPGYIQTIAVKPEERNKGIGRLLIEFAERTIHVVSPNVFMCVSSFNADARRLYERLGYTRVGELPDYIVRGHSEILLRKSLGPLSEFARVPDNPTD